MEVLFTIMDLFNSNTEINLLPKDGTAIYFGEIMSQKEAKYFFEVLMKNIDWKNDEVKIFGKQIITKRKVAWYADANISYTYSNSTKVGQTWISDLLNLKTLVEEITHETYNACLLNLYHNGEEAMGWHSDDEKSIVKNAAIASLSFGAERKFTFKHKQTRGTVSQNLTNGSLLLMQGETQTHWLHALNKTKKVHTPRINLTFRKMIT